MTRKKRLVEETAVKRLRTDSDGVVHEELDVQSARFIVDAEPPFVKLYIQDLGRILELPKGPHNLLFELIKRMDYEGFIALTTGTRERIGEKLNLKAQTLANYLHVLVDKDVLINISRGDYKVNPNLIAKGEWRDIYKRRLDWEVTIKYSADGQRTIQARSAEKQLDFEDYKEMTRKVA